MKWKHVFLASSVLAACGSYLYAKYASSTGTAVTLWDPTTAIAGLAKQATAESRKHTEQYVILVSWICMCVLFPRDAIPISSMFISLCAIQLFMRSLPKQTKYFEGARMPDIQFL